RSIYCTGNQSCQALINQVHGPLGKLPALATNANSFRAGSLHSCGNILWHFDTTDTGTDYNSQSDNQICYCEILTSEG
ncbi:MAG: hypothetical protein KKD98_00450, partial [Candidatus Thermoplasmatota archaeon]|nr:hypothetical protein [Candidatus Thermoplasmatota archaeon]